MARNGRVLARGAATAVAALWIAGGAAGQQADEVQIRQFDNGGI